MGNMKVAWRARKWVCQLVVLWDCWLAVSQVEKWGRLWAACLAAVSAAQMVVQSAGLTVAMMVVLTVVRMAAMMAVYWAVRSVGV